MAHDQDRRSISYVGSVQVWSNSKHTRFSPSHKMVSPILHRLLAFIVSYLPVKLRADLWQRLVVMGQSTWPPESASQRILGGMYVKQSFLGGLEEGEAMRFVAAHTSIPIPFVIDNVVYGERSYLVMSRLPGEQLSGLYPELPPEAEPHLSAQLSRMLAPLRALPAPSGAVCGFGGGPVNCWRMTLSPPLGPWESVAAFHRYVWLRAGGLTYMPKDVDSEMVHSVIREVHSREYRLCLTHNDLGPHNILVDEHWNITGIVDWESCAWMPEYWELSKGCYLPQYRKGRWNRIMSAVFPQYALELEAEHYIVNWRQCYG